MIFLVLICLFGELFVSWLIVVVRVCKLLLRVWCRVLMVLWFMLRWFWCVLFMMKFGIVYGLGILVLMIFILVFVSLVSNFLFLILFGWIKMRYRVLGGLVVVVVIRLNRFLLRLDIVLMMMIVVWLNSDFLVVLMNCLVLIFWFFNLMSLVFGNFWWVVLIWVLMVLFDNRVFVFWINKVVL